VRQCESIENENNQNENQSRNAKYGEMKAAGISSEENQRESETEMKSAKWLLNGGNA
jgi:hypothetical protein